MLPGINNIAVLVLSISGMDTGGAASNPKVKLFHCVRLVHVVKDKWCPKIVFIEIDSLYRAAPASL